MAFDRDDRVLDWREELLRITPRLLDLPIAARAAIYDVVEQFLLEDASEGLTEPVLQLVRAA